MCFFCFRLVSDMLQWIDFENVLNKKSICVKRVERNNEQLYFKWMKDNNDLNTIMDVRKIIMD